MRFLGQAFLLGGLVVALLGFFGAAGEEPSDIVSPAGWIFIWGGRSIGLGLVLLLLSALPDWIRKLFAKKSDPVVRDLNPIFRLLYHTPYRPGAARINAIRRERLHRHRHSF